MNISHVFLLLCLFIIGAAVTEFWILRLLRIAKNGKFVDIPNERSSHTKVTPRGGGLLFGPTFAVGCLVAAYFLGMFLLSAFLISLGALLLTLVGVWDDLKGLTAKTRFFMQLLSASLGLAGGIFYLTENSQFVSAFSWVFFAFWWLYTISAINFFNFADGINGYVGLFTLVVICTLLGFQYIFFKDDSVLLLLFTCACLTGSLIAFLRNNFLLGRVFMGDTGSTVLGYVVSIIGFFPAMHFVTQIQGPLDNLNAFSIQTNGILKSFFGLAFLVATVQLLFLDCTAMVIAKVRIGFPLSKPHREHAYQRFSRQPNTTHTTTTLIIVCSQALFNTSFISYCYFFPISFWSQLGFLVLVPFLVLVFLEQGARKAIRNISL